MPITVFFADKDITRDELPPTYSDLQLDICLAFGSELPRHYQIKYLDPDGDFVIVSNDEEFKMMLDACKDDLTIYVTPDAKAIAAEIAVKQTIAPPPPAKMALGEIIPTQEKPSEVILHQDYRVPPQARPPQAPESTMKRLPPEEAKQGYVSALPGHVYPNTTCARCNMSPIVGLCYVCSTCQGLLLCHACEGLMHHPHPFLKIDHPAKLTQAMPKGTGLLPTFDLGSVTQQGKNFWNATVDFVKGLVPDSMKAGLQGPLLQYQPLLQYPARATPSDKDIYVAIELRNPTQSRWPQILYFSHPDIPMRTLGPGERFIVVAKFENTQQQVGQLTKSWQLEGINEMNYLREIGVVTCTVNVAHPVAGAVPMPHESKINKLMELGVQQDIRKVIELVAWHPTRGTEELAEMLMEMS